MTDIQLKALNRDEIRKLMTEAGFKWKVKPSIDKPEVVDTPKLNLDQLRAELKEELRQEMIDTGQISGGSSEEPEVSEAAIEEAIRDKAMALSSVTITPLGINEQNSDVVYRAIGTPVLGVVSRYIPMRVPSMVPDVLLSYFLTATMQVNTSKRNDQGIIMNSSKTVPAYAVTVHEEITEADLANLKESQKAIA